MTNHQGGAVSVQATIAELVTRAAGLAAPGGRFLLGIVGTPGSGKSTLCEALVAGLGNQAVAVGMDGFHLDNPVLEMLGRRDRKGAPDTFDVDGYVSLLRRLREAREPITYAPLFDRGLERAISSAVPVPRCVALVVTEGNYLLHDHGEWSEVGSLLDEVWFLDIDSEERRRRLVQRRISHGEGAPQASSWVVGVDEVNAAVVSRGRGRADLIVRLVD